ncbi:MULTISPECIES: MFS transporter [Burkholderia cepacia complex]|uniref:MFS transporter n=1 Tax=Burkholderia cepacia complex TaxID=87882 RepID=UPI000F084ABF|nr:MULTISPECIES: MFS transporter [Burkholderia cepacia complex]AYQ43646.1 MFS transporter [Burkholderia lata]
MSHQSQPARGNGWSVALVLTFAVLIAACHGKTIVLVTDIAHAYHVSPAHASWVVSAVAVVAAIGSPFVNWAVAEIGERRAIAFGLVVAAFCSFAESRANDFSTLVALRVVEGVGYISVVLAALALLIHLTAGRQRTTALAFWSVASPLGGALAIFAVSPLVGGAWRVAFSGHAIVLLALLAATPLLPDTGGARPAERRRLSQVLAIYANPSICRLAFAVGAPLTVALGLVIIEPAYFVTSLGVSPAAIGLISTVGILSSVAAGILAGYVLTRPVAGPIAVLGAAAVGLALEILVFVPGVGAPVAIAAKIGQGFFGSFVMAWVFTRIPSMSVGGDVTGAGGVAEQCLYLSMFIGPVALFPLFALPSRLPLFAVLTVAALLPLVLLPLGLPSRRARTAGEPAVDVQVRRG